MLIQSDVLILRYKYTQNFIGDYCSMFHMYDATLGKDVSSMEYCLSTINIELDILFYSTTEYFNAYWRDKITKSVKLAIWHPILGIPKILPRHQQNFLENYWVINNKYYQNIFNKEI